MGIGLLDINDSNLQLWHNDKRVQSPGYALLQGQQYLFGAAARSAARSPQRGRPQSSQFPSVARDGQPPRSAALSRPQLRSAALRRPPPPPAAQSPALSRTSLRPHPRRAASSCAIWG